MQRKDHRFYRLLRCFALVVIWLFALQTSKAQGKNSWINEVLVQERNRDQNNQELAFLIDQERYEALRELDEYPLRVVRRISNGKIIFVSSGIVESTLRKFQIQTVNNQWKWSESVFHLKKSKKVSFLVSILSDDITEVDKIIKKYELSPVYASVYIGLGTKRDLKNLAEFRSVRFISLASNKANEESRVVDLNLNPNRISKVLAENPHLDGHSITASVKERAFDTSDLDLRGRTILSGLESIDKSNHATEMATIIAGAGNSFITGRGVARAAVLTGASFDTLFPERSSDYERLNVHLQNHSYGTDVENYYGLSAQAYDQSVNDNSTLVHVFSVGNSGAINPSEGAYAGVGPYANLTGNFKNAKNVLVIGAVDTLGSSQIFSSRGPTGDGRVKPDLSAYSMVGSSNSAALVSGTVLLLQQQFLERWRSYPSSDLVRAVLIAGSEDLDDPGPDYERGFGNLNAFESLKILKGNHYIQDTLKAKKQVYSIDVIDQIEKVTVVLTWIDPPANPGDEITLVNDLDLKVIGPDGSVILPWVLSRDPVLEKLSSPATRGIDDFNTVELVSFEVEEPGKYTLEISGEIATGDQQLFTMVYKADTTDQFQWDYPLEGSHMPYNGETGTYFRWSSTLQHSYGDLYYAYRGRQEWTLIRNEIDLSKGFFRWDAAQLMGPELVEAMMVVDSDTFKTSVFTVSTPLDANVGFDCGDSLLLQWSLISGVDSYLVKQPGEQYLEDLVLVEDSLLLLSNPNNPLFSITPMIEDYELLPSYTFDYIEQQSGCFIQSFFQEVDILKGIYLNVQLGSVYGVESILIESWKNNQYVFVFETTKPLQSLRILDSIPNQGYNQHKLTVRLQNGQVLEQVVGDTYFLTTRDVLVFPNPVGTDEMLRLYTRETIDDIMIKIHDSKGKLVSEKLLGSTREVIPLNDFQPGLYLYTITIGKQVRNGKLLVY